MFSFIIVNVCGSPAEKQGFFVKTHLEVIGYNFKTTYCSFCIFVYEQLERAYYYKSITMWR